MVGFEPHGAFRLTFDLIYLSDGIKIVIIGLGMFAVPEIIDLVRRIKPSRKMGRPGQRLGEVLRTPLKTGSLSLDVRLSAVLWEPFLA